MASQAALSASASDCSDGMPLEVPMVTVWPAMFSAFASAWALAGQVLVHRGQGVVAGLERVDRRAPRAGGLEGVRDVAGAAEDGVDDALAVQREAHGLAHLRVGERPWCADHRGGARNGAPW